MLGVAFIINVEYYYALYVLAVSSINLQAARPQWRMIIALHTPGQPQPAW